MGGGEKLCWGEGKKILEKKHVQGCQISGFLVLFIKIHDGGGGIRKNLEKFFFFVSRPPPYNAKWNSPGMKK